MQADFYAHLYFDDPKAANVDEDEDFNPETVAQELGYKVDDWENL